MGNVTQFKNIIFMIDSKSIITTGNALHFVHEDLADHTDGYMNNLVPSCTYQLSDPMLTQIDNAFWCH